MTTAWPWRGFVEVAVHGGDALNAGALARQCVDDRLADADAASADRAGEAAEVVARIAQHHLHGEAEWAGRLGAAAPAALRGAASKARPLVPSHVLGAAGDVVAGDSGHRNGEGLPEAEAHGKGTEIRLDLL